MSSKNEAPAVSALKAAANMLVAARELKHFSEPVITEAFKLLHSSNPTLVDWVFQDLADMNKEALSASVGR